MGALEIEKLTYQHDVRMNCKVCVEERCLAVGNVVGHNTVSASRMNSIIVIFLNTLEKVNEKYGIVIYYSLTHVSSQYTV